MPTPNLIHPVWVTVERLVRDSMIMDDEAREPIHGSRTAAAQTFRVPAQFKWEEKDDPQPQEAGAREESRGYILCRYKDLDLYLTADPEVGKRFKRGDRITIAGHLTGLDLYITGEGPNAHYPETNGASLVKYHFIDRKPKQQRGDL